MREYDEKSYASARDYAQQRANETGRVHGVEKLRDHFRGGERFNVMSIPQCRKFRFGPDARCEEVYPDTLEGGNLWERDLADKRAERWP